MNVRKFHNNIKRSLIKEHMKKKQTQTSRLLDLACGRGGDIHKWISSGVSEVLAVDGDYAAIEEAQNRYASVHAPIRIDFLHADISAKSTSDRITQSAKLLMNTDRACQFDMVSMFFALQYFVENDKELHALVKLVERNLKPGGFFIGASPRERNILNLVSETGDRLSYSSDELKIGVMGNKCHFWVDLGEESYFEEFGESSEYLVNMSQLRSVCEQHGLECRRVQDFEELGIPPDVTGEMRKFSKLYCSWVFYKPVQTIYFPSRPSPFRISDLHIEQHDMPMVTKPYEAQRIKRAIRTYAGDKRLRDISIMDATAGVGGDTISFSDTFRHVVSVEQDPDRFQRLRHNIAQYGLDNVTTVNGNCIDMFETYSSTGTGRIRCDVVYVDAPWFTKSMNGEIGLGNSDIVSIARQALQVRMFSLVILKVPFYHSFVLPSQFHITRVEITRKMCIKFIRLS